MINGDAYDGRGLDMTHISCNMFPKTCSIEGICLMIIIYLDYM